MFTSNNYGVFWILIGIGIVIGLAALGVFIYLIYLIKKNKTAIESSKENITIDQTFILTILGGRDNVLSSILFPNYIEVTLVDSTKIIIDGIKSLPGLIRIENNGNKVKLFFNNSQETFNKLFN